MHVSDRLSGAIIVVLGALTIIGGMQLPPMPGQDVGPSAFPIVVGIGLLFSGLLVALGIGSRFEQEAEAELAAMQAPSESADTDRRTRGAWRVAIPPVLLLFYVAVSGRLGFVLTAGLMVLATSVALGARMRLALPLAVVAPVIVHLLFAKLLRVPLPIGILPMPW